MSCAQLWIMVKEGLAFFFTKSSGMPKWNDKNSLSWIENIGEVALYVKGEASTRYAVLGLGYGRRSCACPLVPRSGRRAQAIRLRITGITLGNIIGSRIGKRTGNIGFIISSAFGIFPINRIIGPIPKGIALMSSGYIEDMSSANPFGVMSAIMASKTAHCLCTSELGSGKS